MQMKPLMLAAFVPTLWACGDTVGPDGEAQVAVVFRGVASQGATQAAAAPITLTGGGNTLVIEDIRVIVAEIELERAGADCALADDDDCEEFEGGPFLVNLLDGVDATLASATIPAGSYTELEFEVESLQGDDDDDDSERRAKQAVLAQMRKAYPSFPSDGSMVVRGTYNGTPFTVYFNAEIEVEKEFSTPFQVPGSGSILVNLNPAAWFMSGGEPVNLAALDGQTVEFELELESGIEVEDGDED